MQARFEHREIVFKALLFSLYINDISTDTDTEIGLFTDSCVSYREIIDNEDTAKLQEDIDRVGCWARKWDMRFQPAKCNIITGCNVGLYCSQYVKNKSIEVKNGAVSAILMESFWIKIESKYVCSLRIFIQRSAQCEEIIQC